MGIKTNIFGPYFWWFLDILAIIYDRQINSYYLNEIMIQTLYCIGYILPCVYCRLSYREFIYNMDLYHYFNKNNKIENKAKKLIFKLHNFVNDKLYIQTNNVKYLHYQNIKYDDINYDLKLIDNRIIYQNCTNLFLFILLDFRFHDLFIYKIFFQNVIYLFNLANNPVLTKSLDPIFTLNNVWINILQKSNRKMDIINSVCKYWNHLDKKFIFNAII